MGQLSAEIDKSGSGLPWRTPWKVRVSIGSAVVLGLLEGKLDVEPTTAYLMTYSTGKCSANCSFCPQARSSLAKAELLSRVTWPVFRTEDVLEGVKNAVERERIGRVCIQALNYSGVISDIVSLVEALKDIVVVPVSVSCQPLNGENIRRLAAAGVERIGIALDAATETLFNKVKGSGVLGPYRWSVQLNLLRDAVEVFGRGNVSTHLIVGLGESEKELVRMVQDCVDMSVLTALFAFTPIRGTALEKCVPPSVESYRRVQLVRYLVFNGIVNFRDLCFDIDGRIRDFGVKTDVLQSVVNSGRPFLTSGCPSCNRPFYNERPSGPIYNFPRDLREKETVEIWKQLGLK